MRESRKYIFIFVRTASINCTFTRSYQSFRTARPHNISICRSRWQMIVQTSELALQSSFNSTIFELPWRCVHMLNELLISDALFSWLFEPRWVAGKLRKCKTPVNKMNAGRLNAPWSFGMLRYEYIIAVYRFNSRE